MPRALTKACLGSHGQDEDFRTTQQKPSFVISCTSNQISSRSPISLSMERRHRPPPCGSRSFHKAQPSAGQRMTSSYGGQKIVQDVIVPTGATLKVVDQLTEYPGTGPGSLSFKIPHSHWRVETTSAATTAREWSLQVIQTMDDGTAPADVTSLTTTNANVSQVGANYVIGAVKGFTPELNITYRYAGNPTHYLMGFAPRTAYHVANAGGTITISSATGTGDMTASAAGLLIFPAPSGGSVLSSPSVPPTPTSLTIRR